MDRPTRFRRIKYAAVALAGVVAVFGLYSITVVPLVDPATADTSVETISEYDRARAEENMRRRVRELEPLFAAGAWELDQPKILESDQVRLLMRDYETSADGTVRIFPCTMIYVPQDAGLTPEERIRRAVVLEAPEGALLKFDEGFNLRRMKVGRLVSGELLGPITIRSRGKLPGPEDDLWISTHRVRMNEQAVWTDSPVEFRWGPHYGRGRRMTIRLLAGDTPGQAPRHGPRFSGVE